MFGPVSERTTCYVNLVSQHAFSRTFQLSKHIALTQVWSAVVILPARSHVHASGSAGIDKLQRFGKQLLRKCDLKALGLQLPSGLLANACLHSFVLPMHTMLPLHACNSSSSTHTGDLPVLLYAITFRYHGCLARALKTCPWPQLATFVFSNWHDTKIAFLGRA